MLIDVFAGSALLSGRAVVSTAALLGGFVAPPAEVLVRSWLAAAALPWRRLHGPVNVGLFVAGPALGAMIVGGALTRRCRPRKAPR